MIYYLPVFLTDTKIARKLQHHINQDLILYLFYFPRKLYKYKNRYKHIIKDLLNISTNIT